MGYYDKTLRGRYSVVVSSYLAISWILSLSLFFFAATVTPTHAQNIVGVSIPVGSADSTCYPLDDNVWSVSAPPIPLDVNTGIGLLVNANFSLGENFSLHDHVYVAPEIPDPTRAVVTYQFDKAIVVDKIEIIQHTNGITQIEGFVGDSLGSLTSIGAVFGPAGDITGGNVFAEGESNVFQFNNTRAGRYFRFVIRKTSLDNGWASYRAYPMDSNGNRIRPAASNPSLVPDIELVTSNGAFRFNGNDQSINLDRSNVLNLSANNFSVHAWVNFTSLSNGGPCFGPSCDMSIVDKMGSFFFSDVNDNGWRVLKQSDDHFYFCLGGGSSGNGCQPGIGTTVISQTVAVPHMWYSVVAVKTSTTISIYVNGLLESTSVYGAFTDTSAADLLIGANNPEGAFLNGRVGQVEIFRQALSDAQVQAIYAQSKVKYGR